MAGHLVVLGSINADCYAEVERLPRPGETVDGGGAAVLPGGKGANQAAAAARLGADTRFVGQVGTDAHADALRGALVGAGVDVSLLATVAGPSGQALILLQPGGESSIVIIGGANRAWTAPPQALDAALDGADRLLLQREVPTAVDLAAARAARARGVPVLLDAGGDAAPVDPELLAATDLFSPNETELARETGRAVDGPAAAAAAAGELLRRGPSGVLVKLGRAGSLLLRAGAPALRQEAFAVEAVDSTGAGDCFTAAYAVAAARGDADATALRFAAAAAACCVQVKGAMPSLPAAGRVRAFLEERGEG